MRLSRWVILVSAVLIGAGGVRYYQDSVSDFLSDIVERGRRAVSGEKDKVTDKNPTMKVLVFFVSPDGEKLVRVQKEVEKGASLIQTLRNALQALVAGPEDEDGDVAPSVPPTTKIRAAIPGANSTLYVDFSRALRDTHPGGAWSEFLTAQAVANTVLKNFRERFKRVILLIESQEAETIAGSLSLAAPLKFRGDIVATAPVLPEKSPASASLEGVLKKAPAAGPAGVPSGAQPAAPVGTPSDAR